MTEPHQTDTVGDDTYDRIIDELVYDYDGIFSKPAIIRAVEQARQALEPNATIRTYLPILTRRFAREQLAATAQAEGWIAKKVPELLFVCVHNSGRSQMAAALADHLSAGRVHVRSAGSDPRGTINPLAIDVLAERGITLTEATPNQLPTKSSTQPT